MIEITQTVPCPQCGITVNYDSNNPIRPFCSERCRIIDLGAWADESHRISGCSLPSDSENPQSH